jgi:hypothetical protein
MLSDQSQELVSCILHKISNDLKLCLNSIKKEIELGFFELWRVEPLHNHQTPPWRIITPVSCDPWPSLWLVETDGIALMGIL